MKQPRRLLWVALAAGAAVAALAAVIAVVVSPGDGRSAATSATSARGLAPAAALPFAQPARYTGPQGGVGQFVVTCRYSHSGQNDPIVHAGMPGMSHRHDFYGAVGTGASSTPAQMARQDTTCNKSVDTAAYWHPTLYDHRKVVEPVEIQAYYRAAPGVDPADLRPFPFGLAMIAGDATATRPQRGDATGWTCGSSGKLSDDPPTCPASAPLHMILTFQDCWDGAHLGAEDHQAHVTYSTRGVCPATHPVHLPQLAVSVKFPIAGGGHDLSLASGNIYSAHGDFLNAWDPAGLRREIDHCLKRGVVCDLGTNREEEPLFQAA